MKHVVRLYVFSCRKSCNSSDSEKKDGDDMDVDNVAMASDLNVVVTAMSALIQPLFTSFLPRDSYAKRGICRRRVSVCVSVTLRYCIKMAKRWITLITPHDSPVSLVF